MWVADMLRPGEALFALPPWTSKNGDGLLRPINPKYPTPPDVDPPSRGGGGGDCHQMTVTPIPRGGGGTDTTQQFT